MKPLDSILLMSQILTMVAVAETITFDKANIAKYNY